ncbi:MAG: hypothetical protein NZ518_05715 [Dehalococcoidia bacterium]|nr:hypothetical protein [Dehalococcoidia bacterium]
MRWQRHGVLGGVAALIAVACATGAPAPTANPTPSPSAANATPITQPTTTPPNLQGRVLYHAPIPGRFDENQIFVLDLETRQARQLTSTGTNIEPSWSPDGAQIVYACRAPDQSAYQICIMNADGSNNRQVVFRPNNDNWGPDWSPDGRTIVFVSALRTTESAGVVAKLFSLTVATGAVQQLTTGVGSFSAPRWSRDGSRIFFTLNRAGAFGIYSIRPDGSDEQPLTRTPSDDRLSISPDGRRIVFRREHVRSFPPFIDGNEVFIADADGRNEQRLTFNTIADDWPSFSPDGRWVVFSQEGDLSDFLMVIPAAGGNPAPLIPGGVRGASPKWR